MLHGYIIHYALLLELIYILFAVIPIIMNKIPSGLNKCERCGEYRGEVMKKDLNWEGYYDKENAEKSEELIGVTCLCDGILCPKCKKNKIHRPISNSYDEESNEVWHNPWFGGMMGCNECRK